LKLGFQMTDDEQPKSLLRCHVAILLRNAGEAKLAFPCPQYAITLSVLTGFEDAPKDAELEKERGQHRLAAGIDE